MLKLDPHTLTIQILSDSFYIWFSTQLFIGYIVGKNGFVALLRNISPKARLIHWRSYSVITK